MIFKNYYKLLDLETSKVSIDEIKSAYRQAAKKYHPDVNVGDKLAEEKIKDINEAYRILSNPSSKRKYDRTWNAKFLRGEKAFDRKDDKKAIFNMFLGNLETNKTNNVNKKIPLRGENVETEININLNDAFYGNDKQISFKSIDGNVKTFTVSIPKGIRNGEKIRLLGQGKEGQDGGKNGDMFIKVNIEGDSRFKLNGYDIYTDLLLTPSEAALGARTSIATIDDETKVYVPKGIQSGEKIRIPNKGYYKNNGIRGDLVAEVKVVVPKNLTEEEEKLYKKLEEISKFSPRQAKK